MRARSWIFTLSPGAKVREVDREKDRGAFLAPAVAARSANSNMRVPNPCDFSVARGWDDKRSPCPKSRFIRFLAECSTGKRPESWDCRADRPPSRHPDDRAAPQSAPGAVRPACRGRGRYRKPPCSPAEHNHRVPRRRLPELPLEEQIPRQRCPHIPAHKVGVALHQRFGVGKLSKGAICGIRRLQTAPASRGKSPSPSGVSG